MLARGIQSSRWTYRALVGDPTSGGADRFSHMLRHVDAGDRQQATEPRSDLDISPDGAPADVVGIGDIHVKECRKSIALAGFAHHQHRITDGDLKWTLRMRVAGGVEDAFEKNDEAGGVAGNDPRSDAVPAGR